MKFTALGQGRRVTLNARRTRVFDLLLDFKWHPTSEIESPAIGGSQGTRRLRELRADGYPIEKRPHAGHDDYEYRLVVA